MEDANGKVILEPDTEGEQVLNPGTADVMIHLLRNVVTASNGTGGPYAINNQFTFAKSGTTSDNKDKWFVGGTSYYVAAVWSGFKYRKTINTAYYGSNPSGKVFKEVMQRVHEGLPYKDFEYAGDAVQRTFCRVSGNLASSICKHTGVGWFRIDALPPRCSTHAGYSVAGDEEEEETTKKGEKDTTKKGEKETTKKGEKETTKKGEKSTTSPVLTTTAPPTTATPPVSQQEPVITDPPTEPPATTAADEDAW